jgi:hypothetical protein
MVNFKIEELRKRAFILYEGMDGVDRVNRQLKRVAPDEDAMDAAQIKEALSNIIKNVFVDHVGLDRTRELLAQEVTHVPGYHRFVKEDQERISIPERIQMMGWMAAVIVALVLAVVVFMLSYTNFFNPLESCDLKKENVSRDSCFRASALSSGNVSVCERMSSPEASYNCVALLGIRNNDTAMCATIPADTLDFQTARNRCIMCVAFNLHRISVCSTLDNPIKEAECAHQIETGRALSC